MGREGSTAGGAGGARGRREQLSALFAELIARIEASSWLRRELAFDGARLTWAGGGFGLPAGRLAVLAAGKAARGMAAGAAQVLGSRVHRGLVVPPADAPVAGALDGAIWQVVVGEHPLPGAGSAAAAREALDLVDSLGAEDALVVLLSGGASALLEWPAHPSISMAELRETHRRLVACGASIGEVNRVRRALSAVKGGRLARRAAPARVLTLAISDVPAGEPEVLASGPTLPDPARSPAAAAARALEVIDRWGLRAQLPARVVQVLERDGDATSRCGAGQGTGEGTARSPGDARDGRWPVSADGSAPLHVLLDNARALDMLAGRLRERGVRVLVDPPDVRGEETIPALAERLLATLTALHRASPAQHVAVVAGGEVSSPVCGDGVGGRNQAFVLDCVPRIAGTPVCVLSAGTDGIDGNSSAAGARADGTTAERARRRGLDLDATRRGSDSGAYFATLGDAVVTGPTGTNVRDVRILVWPTGGAGSDARSARDDAGRERSHGG